MKYALIARFLFVVIGAAFLQGCIKEKETTMYTYTISTPVLKSKATVLAEVESANPKPLESPGKIFLFGNYLFVNEVHSGVHIFDNSQASDPKPLAFINIPGNVDIAVKGNTMYADMYSDLLVIDISRPLTCKLARVIPDVFPEKGWYGNDSMVVVGWIEKDTTVELNSDVWMYSAEVLAASNSGGKVTGVAGSMARFSIVNNFLYAVNTTSLDVFDISDPQSPLVVDKVPVGMEIETIYPFADRLFIGSASGMFIFNISDPRSPEREGSFSHARACDPVVANEKYAFVTLRTGNLCAGNSNQLDILDVENVMNPVLLKTYPLKNPHGLAIDDDLLFLCDGEDGLKVYDAADVLDLKKIAHFRGLRTFDVIAYQKNLLLVHSDGIDQYNYSDRENIRRISRIPVQTKLRTPW